MGNDCQILPIYGVQEALEDDFLILAPDLRILSATLPLHPQEESQGLIDVNYVDLDELLSFLQLLKNFIDDVLVDPGNIG